MCSIVEEQVQRQVVPDAGSGVVIGIDVSKGWIDWRARWPRAVCEPETGPWG